MKWGGNGWKWLEKEWKWGGKVWQWCENEIVVWN